MLLYTHSALRLGSHIDGRVLADQLVRRVDGLSSIVGVVALHPDVL